jgi:F420-non-reducing hydrogenase small subunit
LTFLKTGLSKSAYEAGKALSNRADGSGDSGYELLQSGLPMSHKSKLAIYWASSCGGCEIAVVNLHEKLLEVDAHFEFVFCPCLLDTKVSDLKAMPDGEIGLTLFNGAIRTEENEEMAQLLRKKSKVLIAYGSCSAHGSIPALSNLHQRDDHLRTNYLQGETVDNAARTIPQTRTEVPEGSLELPAFYERVKTLSDVVAVDYFLPGCPPESQQIWDVIETLIQGKPLPPRNSVIGAGQSTVCRECLRKKEDKRVAQFRRTYEVKPDCETCLLEQGIVCLGIATRDGCGALCPAVNMPCSGCYGPAEGVWDQGAKMTSALGSVLDLGAYAGLSEAELAAKADGVVEAIPDQAGTFYRYSMGSSLLKRSQ